MKFIRPRPFTNPDTAARKLGEIANDVEAVMDGRIYIERINAPFFAAGGSGEDFRAGIARTIAQGWLWRHESSTYVKLTEAGAALFASGKFTGAGCGKRGADVRPDFNWDKRPAGVIGKPCMSKPRATDLASQIFWSCPRQLRLQHCQLERPGVGRRVRDGLIGSGQRKRRHCPVAEVQQPAANQAYQARYGGGVIHPLPAYGDQVAHDPRIGQR
jgi:hypothetical protein